MTFGACCFGEVSALARTGLFTTSFGDASAVSAALDFARCWPRCFSHVSTSQQCVGCFFRILVSRPVSTISGLALVVRYWKATLGDLRRRLGTRSSQSLIFAVAMKGTPRRYGRRARPDRRLDAEKNSNPPEAGDRPLGGGPGCHIVRVGALELSEKHLAGEQLSSLARGRPAGYGGAPAARAEVWARKQTASRQPKRVS